MRTPNERQDSKMTSFASSCRYTWRGRVINYSDVKRSGQAKSNTRRPNYCGPYCSIIAGTPDDFTHTYAPLPAVISTQMSGRRKRNGYHMAGAAGSFRSSSSLTAKKIETICRASNSLVSDRQDRGTEHFQGNQRQYWLMDAVLPDDITCDSQTDTSVVRQQCTNRCLLVATVLRGFCSAMAGWPRKDCWNGIKHCLPV